MPARAVWAARSQGGSRLLQRVERKSRDWARRAARVASDGFCLPSSQLPFGQESSPVFHGNLTLPYSYSQRCGVLRATWPQVSLIGIFHWSREDQSSGGQEGGQCTTGSPVSRGRKSQDPDSGSARHSQSWMERALNRAARKVVSAQRLPHSQLCDLKRVSHPLWAPRREIPKVPPVSKIHSLSRKACSLTTSCKLRCPATAWETVSWYSPYFRDGHQPSLDP